MPFRSHHHINFQVAELKRINKIEKDYEIHARKIIKVPITPHSLLLENLPIVHKSGQSSPKHGQTDKSHFSKPEFNEKLLVAAVSLSSSPEPTINEIILNTSIASNHYQDNSRAAAVVDQSSSIEDPLLPGVSNAYNGINSRRSRPHSISGQNMELRDLSCNGSDCDISWICLLICILVLCFAIPLIYVFYIAEHEEEFHNHTSTHRN